MFYRVREVARNFINYLFMANKCHLDTYPYETIVCNRNDITYIINSSTIAKIEINDETKYFRECRKHNNLKEYIYYCIHDYFENILSGINNASEIERLIYLDLSSSLNYRRFVKLSSFFEYNLIEILSKLFNEYSAVGLPSFETINNQDLFIDFITFMNSCINAQRSNLYLKNGVIENCNANKQLATQTLAHLLNLDSLVPKVGLCKLMIDNYERFGTIMDKALGETPAYIQIEDRRNISDNFLKEITTFEFFDALCYQLDHRLDNYYVVRDEHGKIATIQAFDNDASRTFFPINKVPSKTYAGCSGVISSAGLLNRPYVDRFFFESLCSIHYDVLEKNMSKYLSRCQVSALWNRILQMRQAIKKTSKINQMVIVDSDRWKSISEELELDEDKFGCTYYRHFKYDTVMIDRKKSFETNRICKLD